MPTCNKHDYVYYGALNIYLREDLLEVVDAWRCRICHVMRVWKRGPGYLGSTEGMIADLEEGQSWVLLVCKSGDMPKAEIHKLRDGDPIPHTCGDNISLTYSKDSGLMGEDRATPHHYIYHLDQIIRGYIELATTPPQVVSLSKTLL